MTNSLQQALMAALLAAIPMSTLTAPQTPSWVQRLRQLLNIAPTQAVGGSRSASSSSVCLLSPVSMALEAGQTLVVGVTKPVLWAAQPLNELILEQDGETRWQVLATSRHLIEGPILWPLPPLKPGEMITLRLRAARSSGADFVELTLQAADAATLNRGDQLAESLNSDGSAWRRRLQNAVTAGDRPTSALLLSSSSGEKGLQEQIRKKLCSPVPTHPNHDAAVEAAG